MIERINWMADPSEKGIQQSGGIMVNYLYRYVFVELMLIEYILMCFLDNTLCKIITMFRLENKNIEEYSLSYSSTGLVHSSPSLSQYLEVTFTLGLSFFTLYFA
jgi:malonyl-CoA decarboxylase